jgi:medium-chain acyl-[acyl-carrier-protein] hydrolase
MSDWIVRLSPAASAPVRIVCLPHPGGGAGFFRPWASVGGDHVDAEVLAVQPPGHESRADELPITDLRRLVRLTAGELAAVDDGRPMALFGHSGGGIYALEVCRALERAGRGPILLCVSAIPPPDHTHWSGTAETLLADPETAYRRLGSGAIPGEVENDPALMAAYIALIRADARLYTGLGMRPAVRVKCPISAFSGEDDAIATPDTMRGWRAWAAADSAFILHRYPGDHFYIREQFSAVLADLHHDLLADRLAEHAAAGSPACGRTPGTTFSTAGRPSPSSHTSEP